MRAGRMCGVVLAMTLFVACTSEPRSAGEQRPVTRLPIGLKVVPGSRVIGIPIPSLQRPSTDAGGFEWALLRVDGEPRAVLDAYVAEAKELALAGLDPKCISVGRPERLFCNAFGQDAYRNVAIIVHSCQACAPAHSVGEITYSGPGIADVRAVEHDPPPATEGKRPTKHFLVSSGGGGWRLRALTGSRLLGSIDRGGCTESLRGIVEVTGDTEEVWRRYLRSAGGAPDGRELRATVHGRQIRQLQTSHGELGSLFTLVSGRGLPRPLLAVDLCAYN